MKTIARSTTLFCIILFVSASAALAQSEAELKSQIEKNNAQMAKDMISGNIDNCLVFYTNDVISMPNYDKMVKGIDALKRSNEEMKKAGWNIVEYKPSTLSVTKNGNTITEIGTYKIALTMKDSEKRMDDMGKYLTIWEKQPDGSLKIKVEMWNTDKNPMMQGKEGMAGNE